MSYYVKSVTDITLSRKLTETELATAKSEWENTPKETDDFFKEELVFVDGDIISYRENTNASSYDAHIETYIKKGVLPMLPKALVPLIQSMEVFWYDIDLPCDQATYVMRDGQLIDEDDLDDEEENDEAAE